MVYSCCVPNCRSGYKALKSENKTAKPQAAMFDFPFDEDLRKRWLKSIKRKDLVDGKYVQFIPGKNHCVCSHHFTEDSFSSMAKRKRLKPGAVPTIFNGYPSYLTSSEGMYCTIFKIILANFRRSAVCNLL